MRTKINHVTVVTMDEQFHVYENGYVVLEGNTILETGEGEGPADADGTVDGKNGILMPGMINTHCHIPMIPFRSLGDDCPDRLRRFLFPLELEAMNREYGTEPADVIACIGPSICQDCFEVGPEVAAEFAAGFAEQYHNDLFYQKSDGKYQVDLWRANQIVLREAGIPADQIHTTDICTRCNPSHLFSHRIMGTERGNLAAFLALREQG